MKGVSAPLLRDQEPQYDGEYGDRIIATPVTVSSITAQEIPAGSLPIFKIWDNEWVPGAFCRSVGWCFIADRDWGGGGNAVCHQSLVDGTVRTLHTDEKGAVIGKGEPRPLGTVELKANGAVLTFAQYKALKTKVPSINMANGSSITFKELAGKREFTGTASVQSLTPAPGQGRFEQIEVDGELRDILVI